MNQKIRDLVKYNRELIEQIHHEIHRETEISYFDPKKSVKVSELSAHEQSKIVYMGAHPKRNNNV